MRNELRAIQKRVGITFIYITHDQGEALTMSDRIAVMNHGVIEQIGDGKTIYENPSTAFVAAFVGENNGFRGRVVGADGVAAVVETPIGRIAGRRGAGVAAGADGIVFIRPEALRLANQGESAAFEAELVTTAFEGNATHLFLRTASGQQVTMSSGRRQASAIPAIGARVGLAYDPREAIVLAADKSAS